MQLSELYNARLKDYLEEAVKVTQNTEGERFFSSSRHAIQGT